MLNLNLQKKITIHISKCHTFRNKARGVVLRVAGNVTFILLPPRFVQKHLPPLNSSPTVTTFFIYSYKSLFFLTSLCIVFHVQHKYTHFHSLLSLMKVARKKSTSRLSKAPNIEYCVGGIGNVSQKRQEKPYSVAYLLYCEKQ